MTTNITNVLPQRSRSNINKILGVKRSSTQTPKKKKVQKPSLGRRQRRRNLRLVRRSVRIPTFSRTGPLNRMIGRAPMTDMEKAYAMCRLNPFKTMGKSIGIPDGSDAKRILMDHRMINTFTVGSSGSVRIAITPCIPSSIWWSGDVDTKVNGASYTQNVNDIMRTICQPEWRDLPCTLQDVAGQYDPAMAIFNATKARIVTVGWNLIYTGTSLDNSGGMVVNAQQLTMAEPFPNPALFTVFSSQIGVNKGYNSSQVLTRTLNDKPSFGYANNNETGTIALNRGAHGILRHSANEYEWCNVANNLSFPAWAHDEKICFLTSQEYATESSIGHWPHVAFFDPSWVSTLININGAKQGATFMLDTLYCVEYCPSPSSSVFAIAKGGPPQNNQLMQQVDNVAKNMPIAKTGNAQSDSSVSNVVSNISTAIKTGAAVVSAFV